MTSLYSQAKGWVSELRGFDTLRELDRSAFFKRSGADIRTFLNTPEKKNYPGAPAHLRSFIRAVCWNIEKGIHWQGIAEALRVDPYLRVADLIFLNEVDVGMARSGNVHVAREIAQVLKMNYVFAPAHLELTKGVGNDLNAPGENEIGLQGDAILSRYPLDDAAIIELPDCEDIFGSREKRYGRRIALKATVYTDHGSFWAVNTHLEVLNTPACRARQMEAILEHLDSEDEDKPILLGGDWNTHSFARGTRWRTFKAYVRLGMANPARLVEQLKHPDRGAEKLFSALRRHGFEWEEFNDYADTCGIDLECDDYLARIPGFLKNYAQQRLDAHAHNLRFRLDWFAALGLKALNKNAATDLSSGVSSVGALTLGEVNDRQPPLSDHHPILVDIELPPEEETQIRAVA